VRLVEVTVCPSTEVRPQWWRRMCDTFKGFSCLPQGVVGGCRGCKFLKKSLDLIVFYFTDELFEVLCASVLM
jgi:hypothetical protein